MASKVIYPIVAALGIAAASGAAVWYQKKSNDPASDTALAAVPAGAAATGAAAANVGAASGASGATGASAGGASAPRPPAVEVAKVEVAKLTDDMQAVGSLRSRQGVVLRPEVSGRITTLNFNDGDRVKKGQLLVQFDDQLQLAQVQQSQAELSIALANHKRNQELVAQNFISKRSVDESSANLEVAQAKLALSKAAAARLKVLAPFDGFTGIRTANVGDYLKDGADVVNIEDIEAVFVDFRLPERFQSKVKKGQVSAVTLDALPGQKFSALVQAVDPLIDANGRSVGVRGCIDNRQLRLRPGMFARVTTVFSERERALIIPEEAIVPQGQRVLVYKLVDGKTADDKTVQRVEVKLGIRRPGRVEVLEGLAEGDQIVTAGQQRLQKDGMAVRVIDANRPPGGRGEQGGAGGTGAQGAPGASGASGASGGSGAPAGPGTQPSPNGPSGAEPGRAPPAGGASAPAGMAAKGKPGKPGKAASGPNPCTVMAANTAGRAPGGAAGSSDGAPGKGRPGGAAGRPSGG